MQSIFARGVYLGENSSQSASVELVRPWRTNYARGRLQAFCPKRASPFLDSLSPPGPAASRVGRGRILFRCLFRLLLRDGGDEGPGQLAPAPVLDIEISDGAEHHGSHEVHEQVLHGVVQADVQVSVKA